VEILVATEAEQVGVIVRHPGFTAQWQGLALGEKRRAQSVFQAAVALAGQPQ
jgi:hypothetical protein